MRPEQMLPAEKQALENLLKIAQGNTGQSRRVSDFLLAWWNRQSAAVTTSRPPGALITTSWKTCA
jgi:hypothetical protein